MALKRLQTRVAAIVMGPMLTACSLFLVPVPTQEPAPLGTAQACMIALPTGRLVADARWGIALIDPAGLVWKVVWPYGYAARQDGRVVLLNAAGHVVAGEGDLVQITGGEIGIDGGGWLACEGLDVLQDE